MLCERLSAWFATEHGGVVKDVLSGKERILPLVDVRRYPCRTLSACHFSALNFVRVAFKHMQRARGGSSPSMVQWLGAVVERHVLEEMLSPCEQLTSEQAIQLEEVRRIPLFEDSIRHVGTKHGPPSMILFKQSLRQMQLHASPVSAMVVSRNASTTVCLKLRENSKDVFLVLDFALAPPEYGHHHGTPLSLVISTSLEQTAARLSGILPVDNHMMTRDRQWQAQLFTSCTICMFTPAEGVVLSSEAESAAINESVALLRVIGDLDERRRDWERERERERDANRARHENHRPSESSQSGWKRTSFNIGRTTTTNRRHASRVGGGSLGEGSSAHMAQLRPKTTFTPYEETKRHCRIFFSDDESISPSPSPISLSSDVSDEESCFECVICFEVIPEAKGICLLPCAHGFCRDCLAGHVCSKIQERKFPVFCPLCMTEQENANPSVVSGDMVRRLGVSEAHYTIWFELEMAHVCVRVHCRRCNRWAFVDKEDHEQREELGCPFSDCEHTWCKNCQQSLSADGPKHSCDGTEELDYLVRQMGWKYCPKCRTPVQKNGGCNHMTCVSPGCNTHFCYRCGKQITRASIPFLVRSAVNAHFKQCTL
ncbi:hypothetical protein OG21DRAFT_1516076 [Imleria badia]|nr:hypothetical protein OG21DRAFT_1516076 [Imleria badia]